MESSEGQARKMQPTGEGRRGTATTDVFTFDYANQILMNSSLGTRVMVLDGEFYQLLTSNLSKVFKSGAQVFLYQMGLAYGELLAKRIQKGGGLQTHTPDTYLQHYTSLAIGKFEFPPLSTFAAGLPSNVTVRLRDSFFAMAMGRTGQAECHVVRGLLEGTAKLIFRVDYQCSEEKCLSKGDEKCEFLLRPAAKPG